MAAQGSGLAALPVDDTHVFFFAQRGEPGEVLKVSKQGGVPMVVAHDLYWPNALTVDHTSIYWTERVPSPDPGRALGFRIIRRAPKGGGDAATVVDTPFPETARYLGPAPIAVDEGFVYWAGDGVLWRAPKDGGKPIEVCRGFRGGVTGIAVHREIVFFVDQKGYLYRAHKVGGPAMLLASLESGGIPLPSAPTLAVDDDALWVCAPAGVYRLSHGGD